MITIHAGQNVELEMSKLRERGIEVSVRIQAEKETIARNLELLRDIERKDPIDLFEHYMKTDLALYSMQDGEQCDGTAGGAKVKRRTKLCTVSDAASESNKRFREAVLLEGKNTISRLLSLASTSTLSASSTTGEGISMKTFTGVKELRLTSVKLSNFGPFGDEATTYPLASRGLVLLRGRTVDSTGADSNEAGKASVLSSY